MITRRRTHRQMPDAMDRLAAAEDEFLRAEFFAPVLRGAGVQVRIAAVRCVLRVEPDDFEGWGVFRPASHALARRVRPARMAERLRYLGLFPCAGLILSRPQLAGGSTWLAAPAARGDARVRVEGEVPVRLVEDAEPFDTVRARFDGSQFWFEQVDPRADPGASAYLRQSLAATLDPRRLDRPGLTAEQREAYAAEYLCRLARREADARTLGERRLRAALAHGGAEFRDFAEQAGAYRVTYTVDGRRHTSLVDKKDLTVRTAGICLSGEDQKFDLGSLVGVLREGRR